MFHFFIIFFLFLERNVCFQRLFANTSLTVSAEVPTQATFLTTPHVFDQFDNINSSNCSNYNDTAVVRFEVYATSLGLSVQIQHNGQLSCGEKQPLGYIIKNGATIIGQDDSINLARGVNDISLTITLNATNFCGVPPGSYSDNIILTLSSS